MWKAGKAGDQARDIWYKKRIKSWLQIFLAKVIIDIWNKLLAWLFESNYQYNFLKNNQKL